MNMRASSVSRPVAAAPSFTPVRSAVLQRQCACGQSSGLSGECKECSEEKSTLQRMAAEGRRGGAAAPPIVHDELRSSDHQLDQPTRRFMEKRLGHDFARVRVHVDSQAAESARQVGSLAYTVGRHIVFGQGRYMPNAAQTAASVQPDAAGALRREAVSINGPDDKQTPKASTPAAPKAPAPSPPPKQQTPPAKAAGCPADIKLVQVDPLTDRDLGKDGVKTGWGGIARMEVSDPDGKDWADTQIHERVKQVKNTCGARGRKVCSNLSGEGGSEGSTFKVGAPGKVLDVANLPGVKNSFHDLHIFMLREASVLHELEKSDCEIQCQQAYDCGGKQIGADFTITYALKKDTVAKTFDVTRVTVKKEAVPKTATPPAPPSGGAKP
jgi:hypothetical protein